MLAGLWGLVCCAVSLAAPPSFSPGVTRVPGSLAFPAPRTEAAVEAAERDVHVVVFEEVIAGGIGRWGSATERATEETWKAWTQAGAGFEVAEDVLVVLALDDREVRVRTGARWDAELGLWGAELLPLIDEAFLPRAKAGDLDGGLAALVTRVDTEIGSRLRTSEEDAWRAEHLPQRPLLREVGGPSAVPALPGVEKRLGNLEHPWMVWVVDEVVPGGTVGAASATEVLAKEAWTALTAQVGFDAEHTTLLVVGVDEHGAFLRPGAYWRRLGVQERRGAIDPTRDLDGQLDAWISRALRDYSEAEEVETARMAEVEARAVAAAQQQSKAELEKELRRMRQQVNRAAVARVAGIGLLGAVPVGGTGFWLAGLLGARARSRRRLAKRRERLEQARSNLAELHMDVETRAELRAMRDKGPETAALVEEVGDAIATLHAGLEALEANLARVEDALDLGLWSRGAVMAEVAGLDGVVRIDTEAAQARLFEGPTRVIETSAPEFMGELDEAFQQAHAGWRRLLDAAAARTHRVEEDLPRDDLDTMQAQLTGAGIEHTWLETHPLVPDADLAWAELDALRRDDPVAYLDELEAAIAEDDALEAVVAELIGWKLSAEEAAAALDWELPPTRFEDPSLDPEHQNHAVVQAQAALREALASGGDLPAVRRAGEALVARCEEAAEYLDEVRGAVAEGRELLDAIAKDLDGLGARRRREGRKLAEMLQSFVPQALRASMKELDELDEDLEESRAAQARAEALFSEQCHLEAVRALREVRAALEAATGEVTELIAALRQASESKEEADRLFAHIDEIRQRKRSRMRLLGDHARGLSLDSGDALLASLRAEWDAEPADWSERLAQLTLVQSSWEQAVRLGEARRAKAAQAARKVAAARAAAARRSASAWKPSRSSSRYSSTRGRSSTWSASRSRSFSSSSRSSGRSYSSSSSRSAGRSYSSGGRSGGRKW